MRSVYDRARAYFTRSAVKALAIGAGTFLGGSVVIVGAGVVVIQEVTGVWPQVQPLDVVVTAGVMLAATVGFVAVAVSLRRSAIQLPYAVLAAMWKLGEEVATSVDPIEHVRKLLRAWLDDHHGNTGQPQT